MQIQNGGTISEYNYFRGDWVTIWVTFGDIVGYALQFPWATSAHRYRQTLPSVSPFRDNSASGRFLRHENGKFTSPLLQENWFSILRLKTTSRITFYRWVLYAVHDICDNVWLTNLYGAIESSFMTHLQSVIQESLSSPTLMKVGNDPIWWPLWACSLAAIFLSADNHLPP